MATSTESACIISGARTTAHFSARLVQCGYLHSDSEYSASPPSYSSGIGSNTDINWPEYSKCKSNSSVDQNRFELSQIISKHRKNCYTHLDNIDTMINNHLNTTGQELLCRNYFMLQNEMIIQKKISETKDEIQKLKNSIYTETVDQVKYFENSTMFFIFIVVIICASVLILSCWSSSVRYNWNYYFPSPVL